MDMEITTVQSECNTEEHLFLWSLQFSGAEWSVSSDVWLIVGLKID